MSTTATLEAVAQAVHDLSESVISMQDGMVDRETVERIAAEVMERSREHTEEINRGRGVTAEDLDIAPEFMRARTPAERIQALHQRPADKVAPLARRDPADVAEFQARADDLLILSTILRRDPRETDFYAQEYLPALRAAMDTQTAGEGQEWVPTELSSMFIERVNLPLRVAALFPTIQMPTPTYEVPASGVSRRRTGKAAEQTADTGQAKFKAVTPGTRKVTLSAVKLAGRVLVSREAQEDSIIPMLPFIQEELRDYIAADLEDAIINGDTTATHQDSDVTDADDPRKLWNGLRDIAASLTGARIDGGDTKLAVADLRANRKAMGKYGIAPANLAHIVSIAGYIDLLDDSSVLTLDKYGPNATILSGELARVDNVPVIVSEYVRDDLNATGVHDGVTETQTIAITAHTRGFFRGQRRGVTVEILRELYAESDQDAVIASIREDFKPRYPTTENVVALTYNLPGSG